jgi:hypothetical protein
MADVLAAPAPEPQYGRRNDAGHYTWKGVKLPSVTTILGLMSGEHLLMWYAKMTASECANIVERRIEGMLDQEDADAQILDWQSRMTAAIRYRDHKAAIGSLTHHAIYERAMGEPVPSDMVEYLQGWAIQLGLAQPEKDGEENDPYSLKLAKEARHYVHSAFQWIDEARPEFEAIGHEAVCVSETHSYAGTTDAIARIGGRRLQLDFKTSNSIDEMKFRMQVEAYRRADFIGMVVDGSEHEIPETEGVGIVWIRPVDPTQLREFPTSDELFEGFLSARHLYGVLNEMPKANHKPRAEKAPRVPKEDKPCPF